MEKTNMFKIGDLVTLKGFDKLTIQEKPMGIIIKLGPTKVLIDWSNQVLADRFALTRSIAKTKIELI